MFTNPFLPYLGPVPYNYGTPTLTTTATTQIPHHTPTHTPTSPNNVEAIQAWVMSSATDIAFFFKGALLGIGAGLVLASMFCCWIPCFHLYYGGSVEELHGPHGSALRVRVTPPGGFSAWGRRRIRLFFLGREVRTVREMSDDEEAGDDGVVASGGAGGPWQGEHNQHGTSREDQHHLAQSPHQPQAMVQHWVASVASAVPEGDVEVGGNDRNDRNDRNDAPLTTAVV